MFATIIRIPSVSLRPPETCNTDGLTAPNPITTKYYLRQSRVLNRQQWRITLLKQSDQVDFRTSLNKSSFLINSSRPDRRQTIIWTNVGISLIGPLGTNFSEILIKIMTFIFFQENAFESVVWKTAAILSRPQCVNNIQSCFIVFIVLVLVDSCDPFAVSDRVVSLKMGSSQDCSRADEITLDDMGNVILNPPH